MACIDVLNDSAYDKLAMARKLVFERPELARMYIGSAIEELQTRECPLTNQVKQNVSLVSWQGKIHYAGREYRDFNCSGCGHFIGKSNRNVKIKANYCANCGGKIIKQG